METPLVPLGRTLTIESLSTNGFLGVPLSSYILALYDQLHVPNSSEPCRSTLRSCVKSVANSKHFEFLG